MYADIDIVCTFRHRFDQLKLKWSVTVTHVKLINSHSPPIMMRVCVRKSRVGGRRSTENRELLSNGFHSFFFVFSFLSSMICRFHWYAITCVRIHLISECAIWYRHCYCCCSAVDPHRAIMWGGGERFINVCERLDHLFSLNYISAEILYTINAWPLLGGLGSFNFTKCFHILGSFSHFNSFLVSFFINFDLFHQHSFPKIFIILMRCFFKRHTHTHTHVSVTYLNFFITIFRIVCWYRIVDIYFEFGSARKAPQIRCHFLCQWWTPFVCISFAFI